MTRWTELAAQWATLTDPDERAALFEAMHEAYLAEPRGGQTPGKLPYPAPSDPVAQGADAIRALAEAIDPRIPIKMVRGSYSFPSLASQASANTVITYPPGTFTVNPFVIVTSDTSRLVLSAASATVNGFTFVGQNLSSSTAAITLGTWLAMQLPAVMLAMVDTPAGDPIIEEV